MCRNVLVLLRGAPIPTPSRWCPSSTWDGPCSVPTPLGTIATSSTSQLTSTDILELLPPLEFLPPLVGGRSETRGGKNSKNHRRRRKIFEDFCSKILQKYVVFSCKNTKTHPKSAKIFASGGRKTKKHPLMVRIYPK